MIPCPHCNQPFTPRTYKKNGSKPYTTKACAHPLCQKKRGILKKQRKQRVDNIEAARKLVVNHKTMIAIVDPGEAWEYKDSIFCSDEFLPGIGWDAWPDGMIFEAHDKQFVIRGEGWEQRVEELAADAS